MWLGAILETFTRIDSIAIWMNGYNNKGKDCIRVLPPQVAANAVLDRTAFTKAELSAWKRSQSALIRHLVPVLIWHRTFVHISKIMTNSTEGIVKCALKDC